MRWKDEGDGRNFGEKVNVCPMSLLQGNGNVVGGGGGGEGL